MKLKNIILLFILTFCLTGCFSDPYKNEKYGNEVIESWFSYVAANGDNLGKVRKQVEEIQTIETTSCKFVEKYKKNYIYNCEISYKEIGVTIIPLSETKTKSLYAVFTPKNNGTFTYKVYNSASDDGIWKTDKELD